MRQQTNYLRSICLVMLVLCISQTGFGQQKPQYTQYLFNRFLINPAVAGIEKYVDVKMGARSQWQSVEGAPKTFQLSANMPLGKGYMQKNGVTWFLKKEHNPYSRIDMRQYRASEPHHGVGIIFQHDRTAQIMRTDVLLSYAYHLKLANDLNLSVGFNGGFAQVKVNVDEIDTDVPNDPILAQYAESKLSPDVGFGLWLYGARFFVGLSAQQLLGNPLSFSNGNAQYVDNQHYYAMVGYKLYLYDDMALVPSVLLKKVGAMPIVGDYNLKMVLSDRLWFGGGYRNHESFSAMAGFNMNTLLNVNYSYDFSTGPVRVLSRGSHEVVLGLMLNNISKVFGPQKLF